jgi:hypothetical protein
MPYQYRWEADSELLITRERPVKRYMIATLGGYFPVLQKLKDGSIGAVVEAGDFHIGERGRLDFVRSTDGGESWSAARPIVMDGPDARNQGFASLSDGTLVVGYVHAGYTNGQFDRTKGYDEVYVIRSTDYGETWSPPAPIGGIPITGPQGSPYGKMTELPDGTILMPMYVGSRHEPRTANSVVLRSRDGGETWADASMIAPGLDETALVYLSSGRLIAMLRDSRVESRGANLFQSESDDLGYTWTEPREITQPGQHPADLLLLASGRLLLLFGHRNPPYGVRGLVSRDEGATWDYDNQIVFTADSGSSDCGYPSAVQLDDGKIFVAYYAYESPGPFRYTGFPSLGPHGAGVKLDESDLP